ncbi:GFA family protein [Oryzibacter oryziterrae]|uniref:GFA family protein n=1 Tax=Oryzibacter oryziterrae TaxID=2766474 RepID=UPI001F36202C|nr:GFA family protein [Oryzibacter oryziterrae]
MTGHVLTGGCLCGSIRYEFDASEAVVDLCHCATCRKSTGGATVAWAQVKPSAFALTRGVPAKYQSSSKGWRHFCGRCGGQLFMSDPAGHSIGVTVGSLDDADAVTLSAHGWDGSRPRWLCLSDDLPRYPADPPYDEVD